MGLEPWKEHTPVTNEEEFAEMAEAVIEQAESASCSVEQAMLAMICVELRMLRETLERDEGEDWL